MNKTNLDYITENIRVIEKKNGNIVESLKEFAIENLDTIEWWLIPDSKLTEDRKLLKHLVKRKSINIRMIGADKYPTNNKTLTLSKKLEKIDKIRKDFVVFKNNLKEDTNELFGVETGKSKLRKLILNS
jgi:hypothetical protein